MRPIATEPTVVLSISHVTRIWSVVCECAVSGPPYILRLRRMAHVAAPMVGGDLMTRLAERTPSPWIEKYRPVSLNDLKGSPDLIEALRSFCHDGSVPHLLLYGPPGTGKTSCVGALLRELLPAGTVFPSPLVLDLNASDDRTIATVRDQIKAFAASRGFSGSGDSSTKYVVLDEVDAMTDDAQAALRRIIEDHAGSTRFFLLCNHLGKISQAIQSRCLRLRLGPQSDESASERIAEIARAEHLDITGDGVRAIVHVARGDLRQAVNLLQSVAIGAAGSTIDAEQAYAAASVPDPVATRNLLECLLNESSAHVALVAVRKLSETFGLSAVTRAISEILVTLDMDQRVLISLIREIASVERRLAVGANEKIQAGAIVAAFFSAREQLDAVATVLRLNGGVLANKVAAESFDT